MNRRSVRTDEETAAWHVLIETTREHIKTTMTDEGARERRIQIGPYPNGRPQ